MIIKKCLDHDDLNKYRPISNLCFIAKILEILVPVSFYFNSRYVYNIFQSANRLGHSTKTALLKVVNYVFLSLSKGNISILVLLDVSSVFYDLSITLSLFTVSILSLQLLKPSSDGLYLNLSDKIQYVS